MCAYYMITSLNNWQMVFKVFILGQLVISSGKPFRKDNDFGKKECWYADVFDLGTLTELLLRDLLL